MVRNSFSEPKITEPKICTPFSTTTYVKPSSRIFFIPYKPNMVFDFLCAVVLGRLLINLPHAMGVSPGRVCACVRVRAYVRADSIFRKPCAFVLCCGE